MTFQQDIYAPTSALDPARFFQQLGDQNTFQTFDDKTERKNPTLARVIPYATDDVLRQFHDLGAGIYVTVNETDGKGRKSKNIVRVRAVWQEDDDSVFAGAFPIEPTMQIETSPAFSPLLDCGRRLARRRIWPRRLRCGDGADGRDLRLRQKRKGHRTGTTCPWLSEP
jgi:hypothetical protein